MTFLTVKQALARHPGLSNAALRYALATRQLPHFRFTEKGTIRIAVEDLDRWIESRRIEPEGKPDVPSHRELQVVGGASEEPFRSSRYR